MASRRKSSKKRGGPRRGGASGRSPGNKSGKPKHPRKGGKKRTGPRRFKKPAGRATTVSSATQPAGGGVWGRILDAGTDVESSDRGLSRLNVYMARCGVASRRACDKLIQAGQVTVNGREVTTLGTKIDPLRDRVVVDDVVLKPERPVYVLLNKPSGVACTNSTREGKPRAIDLVSRVNARLFPVGRLDVDSEGLLLLTNDGRFSDQLMHPRYGVPKTYEVTLRGRIEHESLDKAKGGVWLAEGRTQGFRIRIKRRGRERSHLEVTTTEGRNREIRRVFAKVGFPVLKLKRIKIGQLNLSGLGRGKYRLLSKKEIETLLSPLVDPVDGKRARKKRRRSQR